MLVNDDFAQIELAVTPYFRIISMSILVIVIISAIMIWIWRRQLTQRTSYNLAFWSFVCILIYHATRFFKTTSAPTSACTLARFFENVAKLSAVLITWSIAHNLHRVFIKKLPVAPKLVRSYIPVSIIFSILVSIPGLVYSLDQKICWLNSKNNTNVWPMIYWWITSEFWMLLALTYCLVIVIVVFRIIHRENREIKGLLRRPDSSNIQPPAVRHRSKQLNQAAVRIIMYPIVPILSFTPSLVTFTIQMIQLVGHPMSASHYEAIIYNCTLAADFISSWTGIFAGIAFMWDPVVTAVILEIRTKYGWIDKVDEAQHKPEIQIDESGTFRISSTMPIM